MRILRTAARKAQLLLFQSNHSRPPKVTPEIDPRPEMLCFRGQTLALVRHFFELSSQVGRLPSILGREFFRARVSHHAIPSFEEQVIFVCDIELCLARLSEEQAEIITLVGLYDFSLEEVGQMLHCSTSWIHARFARAIDSLTEIFLEAGVLSENRPDRRQRQVMRRPVAPDVGVVPRRPPCAVKLSQGAGLAPRPAPAGAPFGCQSILA